MKNCAILIQTCDKYEKFWDGFFNFFNKHWDFSIESKIYFCNETKEIKNMNNKFIQIKTGKGTFVQNLKNSIRQIKEDYIFFMLEDFWPISPMKKDLFSEFFNFFISQKLDAFQIGPYTPYYKLKIMGKIKNQNVWKIKTDSNWLFNFQARFWKKQILEECLREPEVSENIINSAIGVELSSNEMAKIKKINVGFFHYFWYPIGGVAYRGKFTEIGNQMNNIVLIDNLTKNLIL